MSIQTDDEETIYQAYTAGEMAAEIIRLRALQSRVAELKASLEKAQFEMTYGLYEEAKKTIDLAVKDSK